VSSAARCPRAGNPPRRSRRPGHEETAATSGPTGAAPDRCPQPAGSPTPWTARPSRDGATVTPSLISSPWIRRCPPQRILPGQANDQAGDAQDRRRAACGRPGLRRLLVSYLLAASLRCQARSVAGVTGKISVQRLRGRSRASAASHPGRPPAGSGGWPSVSPGSALPSGLTGRNGSHLITASPPGRPRNPSRRRPARPGSARPPGQAHNAPGSPPAASGPRTPPRTARPAAGPGAGDQAPRGGAPGSIHTSPAFLAGSRLTGSPAQTGSAAKKPADPRLAARPPVMHHRRAPHLAARQLHASLLTRALLRCAIPGQRQENGPHALRVRG